MRTHRTGRLMRWSMTLTVVLGMGCIPPTGGGAGSSGDDNGGGGGTTIGDGQTGGFQDNELDAPESQPVSSENLPPTGDLLAPFEDPALENQALPRGEVNFRWEAADPNETNVDSTIFIKDDQNVFDGPLFTTGVRTSPEELEHGLSIRFPDAGTFFWGLEITDGISTIRRPTSGVGERFIISEDIIDRDDAAGVVLLCPRATQPALPRTTFSWSLGDTVPIRTQVFVGRAGMSNPFEDTFRVLDVADATAESRTLTEEEETLPVGETLSWGLQIQTADGVLFTFEGQAGESFLVAENVPPTGVLTGPADGLVLADNTADFTLSWTADSGNCEDDVESTVFFESLQDSEEPSSLFDSPIHLSILEGVFQAELIAVLDDLGLTAGTWAWGVQADDDSDQTPLVHSELPDRTFRTFFRNTAPRFADPSGAPLCGSEPVTNDAYSFSYADDNGVETVRVTITFAATEEELFDNPAASLTLPTAPAGELSRTEIVFLEPTAGGECPEFLQGPGFYGAEVDDGVNEPARSIFLYAGPTTGACCIIDAPLAPQPLAVNLVVDRSGSMDFSTIPDCNPPGLNICSSPNSCPDEPTRLDRAQEAANAFVANLQAADQAALVTFSGDLEVNVELTSNKADLFAGIEAIEARCPGTAIYDAAIFGVQQLTGVSGIRAVILVSDGGDTGSSSTSAQAIEFANASGVPVYTIAFGEDIPAGDLVRLRELAELTGGQFHEAPTGDDLSRLYIRIGETLRAQESNCTEGTEEECLALGGEYQGDGTSCASVNCPVAPPPPPPPPIADCDGDGIPDSEAISGGSFDCDLNGVPDECEGSPTVVDAGTLATGTIAISANLYFSTDEGNDLIGSICPTQPAPKVVWTIESGPVDFDLANVVILSGGSLSTPYEIRAPVAGDYVFRLTLSGTSISDTVTLTLVNP